MSPEITYILIVMTVYACLFASACFGAEALLAYIVMITITGNVVVGKVITLFGYQMNPAAALAVMLFWIGSLLTQYNGVRVAKRALYYNVTSLAFMTLVGWLIMNIPSNVSPSMTEAIKTIFGFMPGVLLGAAASFSAAFMFTILVQRKLQKRWHGELPILLQTGLVATATLLDIAIFTTVAYYNSGANIPQMIVMTWAVRLVVIAMGIPVIMGIRALHHRGKIPLLTE